MPSRFPNIILTIADDQRGTALGCAGVEPILTPALDALAARGTRFSQAQHLGSCHGAICAPSRAMLLTGIPYFQLDIALMGAKLLPGNLAVRIPETLGQKLRRAGYHAFATGKWHNGVHTFHPSFDSGSNLFFSGMADHWFTPVHDFDPAGRYPDEAVRSADGFSTEVFARSAIDFIHSRANQEQPFFCYCAFTAPHDPRTPPDHWRRRYDPAKIPLPANITPLRLTGHGMECAVPRWDNDSMDERDELLLGMPRDVKEIKRALAEYYGMISHMDEWIGRIHQAVAEIGQLENTLIIHTADHGLAVGQHGLLGKQNLYQHSLNVPLILAGPGISSGTVSDALCYQHDLHPTLSAIAGQADRDSVFQNLADLLADETRERTHIAAAFRNTQRAVRDRRFKLIEYNTKAGRSSELFDLIADPYETRNLIDEAEHGPLVATLRTRLREWQESAGDREWPREGF